jgi:microcystin-dependent protein
MSKEQIDFWLAGERASAGGSAIVGQIVAYVGATVPSKWLLCDGSLVGINVFQELFAVIGTSYGGDGVSTFALPDLRLRFPFGAGMGWNLHTTGGANNFTIAEANLPPVQIAVSGTTSTNTTGITATSTDSGHTHAVNNSYGLGVGAFLGTGGGGLGIDIANGTANITTTIADGGHAHTITGTTANLGVGTPVAILPSYSVVNYIIYTGV